MTDSLRIILRLAFIVALVVSSNVSAQPAVPPLTLLKIRYPVSTLGSVLEADIRFALSTSTGVSSWFVQQVATSGAPLTPPPGGFPSSVEPTSTETPTPTPTDSTASPTATSGAAGPSATNSGDPDPALPSSLGWGSGSNNGGTSSFHLSGSASIDLPPAGLQGAAAAIVPSNPNVEPDPTNYARATFKVVGYGGSAGAVGFIVDHFGAEGQTKFNESLRTRNSGYMLVDAAIPVITDSQFERVHQESWNCTLPFSTSTGGGFSSLGCNPSTIQGDGWKLPETAGPDGVAKYPVWAINKVVIQFQGLSSPPGGRSTSEWNSMITYNGVIAPCGSIRVASGLTKYVGGGCTAQVNCTIYNYPTSVSALRKGGSMVNISATDGPHLDGFGLTLSSSNISAAIGSECRSRGTGMLVALEFSYVDVLSFQRAPSLYPGLDNSSSSTLASVSAEPVIVLTREEPFWIAAVALASFSGICVIFIAWFYTREDVWTDYYDCTDTCGEKCECCDCTVPLACKALPIYFALFSGLSALCCIFIYYTASFTLAPSHSLVISEYQSPSCYQTDLSWRPHRVSTIAADGECHRMASYGSPEGSMYGRAKCSGTGPGATANLAVYKSMSMCQDPEKEKTGPDYQLGACYKEANTDLATYKKTGDLQYLSMFCVPEELAAPTSRWFALQEPTQTLNDTTVVSEQMQIGGKTEGGILPFLYQLAAYSLDVTKIDEDDVGESSPPLVQGNFTAVHAPSDPPSPVPNVTGLRLDQVYYRPTSGENAFEDPRDPGDGPFDGVLFNRPLDPATRKTSTTYWGNTKMEDTLRAAQAADGAFLYQGLRDSLYDIGSVVSEEGNDDAAFTVSMWLKADNTTVGFPFIITDGFLSNSTQDGGRVGTYSPIVERATMITIGGMPYTSFFAEDAGGYKVYFAVALDGASQTVAMLMASGREEVFELEWSASQLPAVGRIFDGDWHYVAFTSQVNNAQRSARIFIDAESDFLADHWQQCFPEGSGEFPPISADLGSEASPVKIFNHSRDYVTDQGALFAGHFTGGLYNLRFFKGALEQERLIGLGAGGMRQYATISIMGSFALGSGLGMVFLTFLGVTIYQFCKEGEAHKDVDEDNGEEAGDEAQGQGEEAAGEVQGGNVAGKLAAAGGKVAISASSLKNCLARIKAIAALFTSVVQSMALYLQGWRWPFTYSFYMGWFVFPFNFNFNLPALGIEISPLAGPLLQIFLVVLAFLTLCFIVVADKESFETALSHLSSRLDDEEEEGKGDGEGQHHEHEYSVDVKRKGKTFKFQFWERRRDRIMHDDDIEKLLMEQHQEKKGKFKVLDIPEKMTQWERRQGRGSKYPWALAYEPDDDGENDSDSDDSIKTKRKKRANRASEAAKDKPKIKKPTIEGVLQLTKKVHDDKHCKLVFKVQNVSDQLDVQKGDELEVKVKRHTDGESCPKHSNDLIRGRDEAIKERKITCSSLRTPWCKEALTCKGLADAKAFYHCVRKGCVFAVCSECCKMSKDQRKDCERRAAQRTVKDVSDLIRPQYNFVTKPKQKGEPSLMLKIMDTIEIDGKKMNLSDDDDSDSSSDEDEPMLGGRGRNKRGRSRGGGKEDGIEGQLDKVVGKLLPEKGKADEKKVCSVELFSFSGHKEDPKMVKANKTGELYLTAVKARGGTTSYSMSLRQNSPQLPAKEDPNPVEVVPEIRTSIHQCPDCKVHLVPGIPEVHLTLAENLDDNGDSKYQCAQYLNIWSGSGCHGVNEDENFYVCPEENCEYTLCHECCTLGPTRKIVAEGIGTLKALGIGGALGFLTLMAASALYFPVIQTSIMIMACHNTFRCQFPGCYKDVTPQFVMATGTAGLTLLLVGFGFVFFMFYVCFIRKRYIICDERVIRGDDNAEEPDEDQRLKIVTYEIDEDQWQRILDQDGTIMRPLYDQFEFKHMCILPIFSVFKVLLVLPIVFLPPNSLRQLIGASVIEAGQLMFLCATNAYVNPWIDTLSKTGSLHQLYQLTLMSFHRVLIANDPEAEGLSYYMLGGTIFYAALMIIVVIHVAIVPGIKGFLEKRKRRREFREQREKEIEERKKATAELAAQKLNDPEYKKKQEEKQKKKELKKKMEEDAEDDNWSDSDDDWDMSDDDGDDDDDESDGLGDSNSNDDDEDVFSESLPKTKSALSTSTGSGSKAQLKKSTSIAPPRRAGAGKKKVKSDWSDSEESLGSLGLDDVEMGNLDLDEIDSDDATLLLGGSKKKPPSAPKIGKVPPPRPKPKADSDDDIW